MARAGLMGYEAFACQNGKGGRHMINVLAITLLVKIRALERDSLRVEERHRRIEPWQLLQEQLTISHKKD